MTQGWSIVIASWKDILSDYVENNRTLGNLGDYTVVYNYGFLAAYGVGFGYPLLLGLPDDTLDCNSGDWTYLVNMYKLNNGLGELLASGLPKSAVRSIVNEFSLFANAKLKCIIDRNKDNEEAADVEFAIEKLIKAMNLRLDLAEYSTARQRSDYGYITPAAAARSVTVNSGVVNKNKNKPEAPVAPVVDLTKGSAASVEAIGDLASASA